MDCRENISNKNDKENNECSSYNKFSSEDKYQEGLDYLHENKNIRKAFKKFLEASEDGHIEALYQVGYLYMYGEPMIFRNCTESIKYLKKASDKGLAIAQFHLAQLYYQGIGCEQDINLAMEYWKKAAVQGYANAQLQLGDFYRFEKQDIDNALEWYDRARKQGAQIADLKYWKAYVNKNHKNF